MRGVIYARFSSSGQREESIDAQVRFCREYADRHKIDIISVYKDEAISGKESATKKRRDYQRLMRDALAGGFDVILVHKYDRIARSVMEHFSIAAKLAPLKVDLIAVSQEFDNSPEGKMMKVIMWAYSEYYIDNLAAEVKKGHRENALKAVWNGGVAPFGYDVVNKQLVINPVEAVYVRRIFDAVLAGERYADILEEMRSAGVKGKRGREIKYTQVYEMLRNEKYTGVYTYTLTEEARREDRRVKPNAIRVNDAFPAIISREEFEKVQNILRSRRRSGRPMERREYLLSGCLYCGCGARMYGHTSTAKRNNKTYVNSFYACKDKCGNKSIKAEYIEDVVIYRCDAVFVEAFSNGVDAFSTQVIPEYSFDDFCLLRDNHKLSVFLAVPEHNSTPGFSFGEIFSDSPLLIFAVRAGFLLREGCQNGEHQLAIGAHGMYALFFKENVDPEFFQLPGDL